MPVIKSENRKVASYPEWGEINHYGISNLEVGAEVELHYHEGHEYWIIISGKGICTTEGDTYEIGPGDLVLTEEGNEHSLVVTEKMSSVYFFGKLAPGKTTDHLHR